MSTFGMGTSDTVPSMRTTDRSIRVADGTSVRCGAMTARGLRSVAVLGLLVVAVFAVPAPAVACSPTFEEPTIRALGPDQLVVLGTTGERVPGGRLFHVERWFNLPEPGTPIVIAFKEGEPVGDCSYPMAAGTHLIIAPFREPDGRLSAALGTLQADPSTEVGRRYVAEAIALFGPGVEPPPAAAAVGTAAASGPEPWWFVAAAVLLAFVGLLLLGRRGAAG